MLLIYRKKVLNETFLKNVTLSIRVAGNALNPTLLTIYAKNYKVTKYYLVDEDGNETAEYKAEKDNRRFSATSALPIAVESC